MKQTPKKPIDDKTISALSLPTRLGISNKIIVIVMIVLVFFTIGLSVVIGITSFNNLATVTLNELERMSKILSRRIADMEDNSVQIVQSFEINERILHQIKQIANLGPYFALDASLKDRAIEDSEVIYMFQAQTNLIELLKPLLKLNNLNSINFYLVSPFNMIPDAKPFLVLRLNQESVFLTQFMKKGDVKDHIIRYLPLQEFTQPDTDYFDISSVYSVPPEKFYTDNHFKIYEGELPQTYFMEKWAVNSPPRSKVVMHQGAPLIQTWYTVKAPISNPNTFEEEMTQVGLIMVEQVLDQSKMISLKNDLGIEVALSRDNKILSSSLETGNQTIELTEPDTVEINHKQYYYSVKSIDHANFMDLNRSSNFKLNAITLSPISILANLTRSLFFQILYVSLFTMALTGLCIYLVIGKLVNRPLALLMEGVQLVSKGELRHKVKVDSMDELGLLGKAFNEMASELEKKAYALQQAYSELEKRVEERTKELSVANTELRKAKEEADAASKAKSEFLANMSHEIRTPMNGVIAAADLALNEDLSSKARRYLKIIHSSGYSLLGIINDILDFSKIDAGKLNLESRPFYLDELLKNITGIFLNTTLEKQIELLLDIEPDTPTALIGDALRIQQIITNLVSNSIKFTEKGGIISIGVKNIQLDPKNAVFQFYVKDTGIGMSPGYLSKLFEPFSQADASTTRKYGGTGLGLTISKQLVELMHGKIWAESELGKGSIFYFTLTLDRQEIDEQEKYNVPQDLTGLRVLNVDDCGESKLITHKILTSFGFSVDSVDSGQKAIDRLKRTHASPKNYGLIIMDWLMPALNGIEASKSIRDMFDAPIPIIILTAFGEEEQKQEAKNAGVNGFLSKPINPSSLFNAIMEVFGRQSIIRNKKSDSPLSCMNIDVGALKGRRILLTEDNPTNQEIAVAILEDAGIVVDIANNGIEAVALVSNNSYDLLLMDIQMPQMDGFEATRKIREKFDRETLPIVAMTAHALKGDEDKCLASGMDGYVTKPIHRDKLYAQICKYVRPRTSDSIPHKLIEKHGPQDSLDLPETLPGLNVDKALKMLKVNTTAYLRIIRSFYQHNYTRSHQLKKALQDNDFSSLSMQAHSLKGSAGNIGADELHEIAFKIESGVKDGMEPGEIEALVDLLDPCLKQVIGSIEQIQTLKPDQKSEMTVDEKDRKAMIDLMKQLASALESYESDEIKRGLTELKNHYRNDFISQIEQQIQSYDYADALNTIHTYIDASP